MKSCSNYILYSFMAVFFGFFVPLIGFNLFNSGLKFVGQSDFQSASLITIKKTASSPDKILSFVFVGDIMLGRGVEKSVLENGNGNFLFLFKNTDFIKDADIAFGNLEGPISLAGEDLGNLYSFRFQPNALDALRVAGFDVLSVANNHAADWGKDAFRENVFRLKNEGILPVGGGADYKEASSVEIIEKHGIIIGFLGFSDVGPDWFVAQKNDPGILIVDGNFEDLIRESSQKVDILIVSLHFGEEYQQEPNKRQKDLARRAVDSGAKMVIGHHPHVVQEVERHKDALIVYSLGNFIFDQNFSEETMEGLVLEVIIENDEIIAVNRKKSKLNQFFQPELVK